MAKKRRDRPERYEDMTENDWEEWGEKFGKRWEKWGERFGKKMERRTEKEKWKGHWHHWWLDAFGAAGPIIGSIIGIVFLAIGIFLLRLVNYFLGSGFLSALGLFLYANIGLFFVIFLFSGYDKYFHSRHWRHYWMVEPITVGISITIAFWVIASFLYIVNTVPQTSVLVNAANFLSSNLLTIFVAVMIVGYVFVLIKRMIFEMYVR